MVMVHLRFVQSLLPFLDKSTLIQKTELGTQLFHFINKLLLFFFVPFLVFFFKGAIFVLVKPADNLELV